MTVRTSNTPAGLQDYLNTIGQAEHPVLAALRERTLSHRLGNMAIAREQAALLSWLAQLIRVEKYLEIGVFTPSRLHCPSMAKLPPATST